MTPELLLTNLESLKVNKDFFFNSFKSVIKFTLVKEFRAGNDRPYESSDFEDHLKYCENDIKALRLIFKNLVESNFFFESSKTNISCTPDLNNEVLTWLCILCGENNSVKPWNTNSIVIECSHILTDILNLNNCKNTTELFSKKFNAKLTKNVLETIRPKLLPSTWKTFPAAVICYKWVLENIKQPELSSYLPLIIPPSLLLVDDFVTENRILGIECLHHIIFNVTSAELQFCCYGDVIFNALEPLLRIREANLQNLLVPCVVDLAIKLNINFGEREETKWSKFDSILEIYLENMEMEQLNDLRSVYIKYLELLINSFGFTVVRWSKRLLRIFREYSIIAAKHNDEITLNYSLKAIEKFMFVSQKLIQVYVKNLFVTLLIVLYSTLTCHKSQTKFGNREHALTLAKNLFDQMSENDQEIIKSELKEKIQDSDIFSYFYEEIKKVMNHN